MRVRVPTPNPTLRAMTSLVLRPVGPEFEALGVFVPFPVLPTPPPLFPVPDPLVPLVVVVGAGTAGGTSGVVSGIVVVVVVPLPLSPAEAVATGTNCKTTAVVVLVGCGAASMGWQENMTARASTRLVPIAST